MLRWYLSTSPGNVVEITNRIDWPEIEVGSKAEAGSGWEGDLVVGDPSGNLIPLMFRRIYAVQDAAPAGSQNVGNWFISGLKVTRDNPKVLASRKWTITMADENSLLSRRKFVGTDSNRPAETDIERLRWALTTTELNVLDPDEDFIDTANPVNLDAADLRQQGPDEMMDSLMKASGKNYGVMYREDLGAYVIWYFNQNTSTLYESTASLSNLLSEVQADPLVFPLSTTAELDRAGGRMASGMVGKYKTNWLYVQQPTVGEKYAYVDRVASDINVTTLAKATAEFNRQLDELSLPDDEITTTVTVEENDLNLIMHGMRIQVHATHFPNYTDDTDPDIPGYQLPGYADDYVWCRVIERNVRQVGPTTFELPLRLSPQKIIPTFPAFMCLTWPTNQPTHGQGVVHFPNSGDNPKSGDPVYPNATASYGLLTKVAGTGGWTAVQVDGTGTIDVTATASFTAVIVGDRQAEFDILLNGVSVANTHIVKPCGGICAWVAYETVSITGLAVVPGDLIELSVIVDVGIFNCPAGAGTYDQRMVVTGTLS